MKREEAKEEGYTHLGKMYGYWCYIKYFDDDGVEVHGTNWFRRRMIALFTWIEVNVWSKYGAFMIEEHEEL